MKNEQRNQREGEEEEWVEDAGLREKGAKGAKEEEKRD